LTEQASFLRHHDLALIQCGEIEDRMTEDIFERRECTQALKKQRQDSYLHDFTDEREQRYAIDDGQTGDIQRTAYEIVVPRIMGDRPGEHQRLDRQTQRHIQPRFHSYHPHTKYRHNPTFPLKKRKED